MILPALSYLNRARTPTLWHLPNLQFANECTLKGISNIELRGVLPIYIPRFKWPMQRLDCS
jgi:hypothetical protein